MMSWFSDLLRSNPLSRHYVMRLRFSIALEIPCNISDYMSYNKDLAIDWRIKTRIAFINYLKKGYKLTDFFSIKKDENMRCFHILEK